MDPIKILPHDGISEDSLRDSYVAMDMDSFDSDEENDTIEEFTKLIELSERQFGPNEETIEVINLGTEEDRKEVKMADNP